MPVVDATARQRGLTRAALLTDLARREIAG